MDYDANLASVHSNDEYMLIQNLVRYETGGSTRAWIGGHDAVQVCNHFLFFFYHAFY